MTTPTQQPVCLPSLKILSDYWTLRIIDELSGNTALRYTEIERRLEGANTATLSKRLRCMCADGLIIRVENSRADVTYRLTALGNEAIPLLDAINHFSDAVKRASP